ncbi:MAG: Thioredoxin reductase [Hydrogenibacillus schlegelii]|uniref:Ferredoxin--NADP reductase n=1 Tax=Hydrogenibacillus schlegelii TaxID=1484 RepID=A0A2T5GFN5_HYDSH|nr:MAG: Thioredoxin reductase [Hydrogenibacillus schlegelii]
MLLASFYLISFLRGSAGRTLGAGERRVRRDANVSSEQVFDVTVIGGGPAGLFAAFYCGMRDLSCQIIDSLPELGGQLTALYPEKYIYDVGGFPKIRAKELVEQLKAQAMQFSPAVFLEEQVTGLTKTDDGLFVLETTKAVRRSRAVIIAGGVGTFTPRKLPAKGAEAYEGKGVHYFLPSAEPFRGKRVLVVGGGDSAVDYALMLEPVAEKVILIHRRDQFRAHEHSVKQLFESSVEVRTFTELLDVKGDGKVEAVTVIHNQTKETDEIAVDAVVSGLGFVASLGPIKNWGLEIEGNSIVVNSKMETNIPGVYAIGDINTYPGKVKLIAVGLGEAPIAVSNAKTYIDPTAKLATIHSSDRTDIPVGRA